MLSLTFKLMFVYRFYLKQLHKLTALSDSTSSGQIPVLSVHVVSSTTGIVAQPNTKIFYPQWGLLIHLATVHNLSRRLFHLLQLRDEVPEPGLGDNVVRSEDPHPV